MLDPCCGLKYTNCQEKTMIATNDGGSSLDIGRCEHSLDHEPETFTDFKMSTNKRT